MQEIDEELIKIFKTELSTEELVANIKHLLNANVLNNVEIQLCEKILEQIEIIGIQDLESILKILKIDINNFSDILGYEKNQILEKIDNLIMVRKEIEDKKIQSLAMKNMSKGILDKETIDVFFNRYTEAIKIKESNVLESLINIDEDATVEISTSCSRIDYLIDGLENGTITTITGNKTYQTDDGNIKSVNADYKGLWAINIVYKALLKNKNVLYIALGKNESNVYKALLSKHSCSDTFDRPLSYADLTSKKEAVKDVLLKVYEDFKDKYQNNIIVFDENQFNISTHHNLQRLIAYSEKKFKDLSGKGLDLIVLDDFTYMKLEIKRKSIVNKNIIANDYYKFLKNQAKNLLGTGRKIPILLTIDPIDNGLGASKNVGNYVLDFLLYEVQALSDNVLSIYGNPNLNSAHSVKTQILKSKKEIMTESVAVRADIKYYNMEDEVKYLDCPMGETCILSEVMMNQISILEQENKRLKEIIEEEPANKEPITIDF